MLDLRYILEHTDEARRRLARRGEGAVERFDEIGPLGRERGALIRELDEKRSVLKTGSRELGGLQKKDPAGAFEARRAELKLLSAGIKDGEARLDGIEKRISEILLHIPNLPHDSVPDGLDESSNRVESVWGEAPRFDFEPLAHWDIGERLGIIDFERAAKVSGARFAVLRGAGSLMERALIQLMMDVHTREHGYLEVIPPFMVSSASMTGTGQLPKFAQESFRVEGADLFLVPTAEVPVTNLHADEILEGDMLPLRYCAWTPCFRSEAGSYGKDVRGLIRQHQFNKVELVKFSKPEESYRDLDLLVQDAASILKRLGLHHRIVTLCAGDMGFSAAKCYDIEVWLPSQKRFREISSCSNCEDFQARRAGIRYRPEKGARPRLVHTMNGSALAVGRTMIAVLEQHQQADGTVIVPEALRPYMGGLDRIR
jgi:seryl-tRNA synthetase